MEYILPKNYPESTPGDFFFVGNCGFADGGAMSLNDPYVFNISGGTFTLDKAQSGEAVSLSATEDTTGTFQSSEFVDNNARYGGALYLSSGGGDVSYSAIGLLLQHRR